MSKLFTLALLLILSLLSGCSPVYQTTYTYKPPAGNMGKMCIMQCQQSKLMCQQLCDSRKDNCRSNARQDAVFRYEQYKSQRIAQNQPVDKTVDDFYSTWSCNNVSCNCDDDFNTCYASCGGKVIPHTICTAFCDKAPVNTLP